MNLDQNISPTEITQQPTEIIPLPLDRKTNLVGKTQEKLKFLKEDMQTISNLKFLEEVTFENRLKYITEWNIDSDNISANQKIEFNFSFNSELPNENLYLRTTAWQVLPTTIQSVVTGWKEYSRTSLSGELFAKDGKRLIIHDKTQITIGALRWKTEFKEIATRDAKKLKEVNIPKEYTKIIEANWKLLTKSISKWVDPELVVQLFSTYFGKSSIDTIDMNRQENFLTQIDRVIWYINIEEKRIDKNNMSDENKKLLENSIWSEYAMESLENNELNTDYVGNYHEYPELSRLGSNLWIKNPWFLYAFWSVESSFGTDTNERYEEHLDTSSIWMFQILKTNLEWHWDLVTQLSNNPADKSLNLQALEIYLSDNPNLIAAINNYDIHEVSKIYNWPKYKDGGYHIKLQKALNQYNNYKNRGSLDRAA